MARKPRIQQQGMIHHVIARGNNKIDIFRDDNDKIRYLSLINKYRDRFDFILLSYCLMDNHIHLLIKQGKNSLSDIMKGIQQSYTQYFNAKYKAIGHVFSQRFKSKPVSDESYLLSLIAYIHNNPKDLGIDDLTTYKWSSHNDILNPTINNVADVDTLFELIGRNRKESINDYLWLLGVVDDDFVKEEYMKNDELEIAQSEMYINDMVSLKESRRYSIEKIITIIEDYFKRNNLTLKNALKRRIAVLLIDSFGKAKDRDISQALNISPSRVRGIRQEYFKGEMSDDVLNYYELLTNILQLSDNDNSLE